MKTVVLVTIFLTGYVGVASSGPIGYVSNGSTLHEIDMTNANVLATHTLSIAGLKAMAFDPGGTLFGGFLSSGVGQVGTIDPATGNVTFLSQTIPGIPDGLAFNGSALYVGVSGDIQGVDTGTGLGGAYVACSTNGVGLAIGGDGFAWRGFVNKLTHTALGSCSPGKTPGSSGGTGSGYSGPRLEVLSLSGGIMYAVDKFNRNLLSFDGVNYPAGDTPTLTTIGRLPSGMTSLAVRELTFVPEPAAIGLLGTGLAGMAGFLLYRRRRR